jgi:hypothetical protein
MEPDARKLTVAQLEKAIESDHMHPEIRPDGTVIMHDKPLPEPRMSQRRPTVEELEDILADPDNPAECERWAKNATPKEIANYIKRLQDALDAAREQRTPDGT